MPLRILRYKLEILQKHIDTYKEVAKLPLVVALIVYSGKKSPYPYPCKISELFEDLDFYKEEELGDFKLLDLTVLEDSEILRHKKSSLLEMLMKHIYARDLKAKVEQIAEAFKQANLQALNIDLVESGLIYLVYAREVDEIKKLLVYFQE